MAVGRDSEGENGVRQVVGSRKEKQEFPDRLEARSRRLPGRNFVEIRGDWGKSGRRHPNPAPSCFDSDEISSGRCCGCEANICLVEGSRLDGLKQEQIPPVGRDGNPGERAHVAGWLLL